MTVQRTALAVDIGGTKVAVARVEATSSTGQGPRYEIGHVRSFNSREHPDLTAILRDCLKSRDFASVAAIGIGVAGPVAEGRAELTNVGWTVDEAGLTQALGKIPVKVMNDLTAQGFGVVVGPASSFSTIQAGVRKAGNAAVIAVGTGLGEGLLIWDGVKYVPSPSEGGHGSFSPQDDEQIALLRFLQERYEAANQETSPRAPGHVSWERVVSGLYGFRNLYDFVLSTGAFAEEPELARALEGVSDAGPVITVTAKGGSPIAQHVLSLFVRLLAAECGNLALKCLAVGGVYIGGGVLPHIKGWLEKEFCASFTAKGRFRPLMEQIPVRLITDPQNALRGAAHGAMVAVFKTRGLD